MTSQEAKTKLIALIQKYGVDVPSSHGYIEAGASKNKYGAWLLCFTIRFNNETTYYLSSTYLQPEEFDIDTTVTEIEDIEIYVNNEVVEINDKDMREIEEAILIACDK